MKVLTVVGARPQFVKASVVSRALRARGDVEVLVHTGQHYDANLSQVFFEELEIPRPDHHLGVGSLPHGAQTGRMLEGLEKTILAAQPLDWVLVYGDTNSTLAGALAAAKLHVPLAHVEAGLRSGDRGMPEEVNRIVADHVSDLLLAPTEAARAHLEREGLGARTRVTGDVMFDVALRFGAVAAARSRILERLALAPRSYLLATVHRAETTDDPERLRAVLEALARLARDLRVVVPLHPRTRAVLEKAGLGAATRDLIVIEPVGYLDMTMLEKNARLIATDSGGVQKEAFFHEVPCVTLRDETEWVELVALGWNRLAPPRDAASVERALRAALDAAPRGQAARPYGAGDAAERVVAALQSKTTP